MTRPSKIKPKVWTSLRRITTILSQLSKCTTTQISSHATHSTKSTIMPFKMKQPAIRWTIWRWATWQTSIHYSSPSQKAVAAHQTTMVAVWALSRTTVVTSLPQTFSWQTSRPQPQSRGTQTSSLQSITSRMSCHSTTSPQSNWTVNSAIATQIQTKSALRCF